MTEELSKALESLCPMYRGALCALGDIFLPGDPPIPLVLRKSARARRISLRVSQLDGRVTLTLPKRVAQAEALAFAESKAAWIRKHLDGRGEDIVVGIGSELPIGGTLVTVVPGTGRAIDLGKAEIAVPGPAERVGTKLGAYLKEVARDRLAAACDDYAARLGRSYSRITMRDTRSRWGSCTSEGALMFSWRLIMAPPEVLDYVAAHEVAHLAEMNHSQAFWAHVEDIYGAYKAPRTWLRTQGGQLHRYRF